MGCAEKDHAFEGCEKSLVISVLCPLWVLQNRQSLSSVSVKCFRVIRKTYVCKNSATKALSKDEQRSRFLLKDVILVGHTALLQPVEN
jgi:hypothetical protein